MNWYLWLLIFQFNLQNKFIEQIWCNKSSVILPTIKQAITNAQIYFLMNQEADQEGRSETCEYQNEMPLLSQYEQQPVIETTFDNPQRHHLQDHFSITPATIKGPSTILDQGSSKITNSTLLYHHHQVEERQYLGQQNFINIVTDPIVKSGQSSRMSVQDVKTFNSHNSHKYDKPIAVSMPFQIDIKQTSPIDRDFAARQNNEAGNSPTQVTRFVDNSEQLVNQVQTSRQSNRSKNSDQREPLYSQKQGVDVTRLIQQRKDEIITQNFELKKSKAQHRDSHVHDNSSILTSKLDQVELGTTLTITRASKQTSQAETNKLFLGLESVVRMLHEPDSFSHRGSANVDLEPLQIGLQPIQSTIPQSVRSSNRRSMMLTNNRNNKSFDLQNNSISRATQNRKRQVKDQTQAILNDLTEDEKQKLVQVITAVPLSSKTQGLLVHYVKDKLDLIRQKKQQEELDHMQKDLVKSDQQMQLLSERFQLNDQELFNTNANRRSYIGNLPMQEPPYTLNYQKERRERMQRLKNGLPLQKPRHKHTAGSVTIQKHPNSGDNSHESIPNVSKSQATSATKHHSLNMPRLKTQQNQNERTRVKDSLQIAKNQTQRDEHVGNGLTISSARSKDAEQSNFGRHNDNDQAISYDQNTNSQQRNQHNPAIFASPRDSVSGIKIGNNLLFGQKVGSSTSRAKHKSQVGRREIDITARTSALKPKLKQIGAIDDSLYGTPEALMMSQTYQNRASFYQPQSFESSIDQVVMSSTSEGEYSKQIVSDPNSTLDQLSKVIEINNGDQSVRIKQLDAVLSSKNLLLQSQQQQSIGDRSSHYNNIQQGRLKQLQDYQTELIASQVKFEMKVEESSLEHDAFMTLVQKRDLQLEQYFFKSFKSGPGVNQMPPVVQDIVLSLIDGYKATLLAFGKFSVRQKQQMTYKIERQQKVIEDLKKEAQQKKAYDQFLKEKMQHLKDEMKRIEVMIDRFNDSTLLGENKDQFRDTFSQVNVSLEAIAKDLSQDRVALTPSIGAFGDDQDAQGGTGKTGKGNHRIEVIPFSTFQHQIDSNYTEIQSKTTRAIIKRLGLGTGSIQTQNSECQTIEKYVHKSEYKEKQALLTLAIEEIENHKKEIVEQKKQIAGKEEDTEKLEKQKKRGAKELQDSKAKLLKAQQQAAVQDVTIKECEAEIMELKKLIQDQEHQTKALNVQIQKSDVKLAELRNTNQEQEQQCKQITSQYDELINSSGDIRAQIEVFRETIRTQSNVIDQQKIDMENYKQKKRELEEQTEKMRANLDVLKNDEKSAKEQLEIANLQALQAMGNSTPSNFNSTPAVIQTPAPIQNLESDPNLENTPSKVDPGILSGLSGNTLPIDGQKSLLGVDNSSFSPDIIVGRLQEHQNTQQEIKEEDDSGLKNKSDSNDINERQSEQPYDSQETESEVSSSEHQDAVCDQPLDLIKLRQNLKRQATLCPTKSNTIHRASQTNHSGPIGQVKLITDNLAAGTASEVSQSVPRKDSNSFTNQPPIYQFSYNNVKPSEEEHNFNDQMAIFLKGIPPEQRKTIQGNNAYKSDQNLGKDSFQVVLPKKLDKKLLQKGGKIRKGSVFGSMVKNHLPDLDKMKLSFGRGLIDPPFKFETEFNQKNQKGQTNALQETAELSQTNDLLSNQKQKTSNMFSQNEWFMKNGSVLSVQQQQTLRVPSPSENKQASSRGPTPTGRKEQQRQPTPTHRKDQSNMTLCADGMMTPSRRSTQVKKHQSSFKAQMPDTFAALNTKRSNESDPKH